jgi:hypothetical protein
VVTAAELVQLEKSFGGFVTRVPIERRSIFDPRPVAKQARWNTGGDRMERHGYSVHYARHLNDRLAAELPIESIAEVGTLFGTGLAVWRTVYPNATVIGFDLYPERAYDIAAPLAVPVFQFDQYERPETEPLLDRLYTDHKIDVYIDDAAHTDIAILNGFERFLPYMAPYATAFIEDNAGVAKQLLARYGYEWQVYRYGRLTVMERHA